jgi:hypothetical protein
VTKAPHKDTTLGVMSIATNVYLKYWMALASSIDTHVTAFQPVVLHVFTDQAQAAREFAQTLTKTSVVVHEIEPLGWPEATLFRYKIFSENIAEITEPFLMYLDADTLVTADFEDDLGERMAQHGVLLVEQAGSWRPSALSRVLRFYFLHPGAIFADTRKLLLEGGLGTWETRRISQAFVPRSRRKSYVTGAVWMGEREALSKMMAELATRVEHDWERGIVAVWHDESHLNWWSAEYQPELLDPRYYFFEGHRHLDELPRIIQLIRKDQQTR